MDRRTFLKSAAAGAGAAALASTPAKAFVNIALPGSSQVLPIATKTPVKTIVVMMMENRSVNHYLGWYGAELEAGDSGQTFDGRTAASYLDRRPGSPTEGDMVETASWGGGEGGRNNFHGRGYLDPGHNINSGRVQANITSPGPGPGLMDGWLASNSGTDEFALSTYGPEDIPVWADLVRSFGTYDRYFCSFLGNTQPNRWYYQSAQTGGEVYNTLPPERAQERPEWAFGYDWPTIFTLLDAAGVSWVSYYSNISGNLFWGPRHMQNVRHISEYYAAAATGTLPQVVFVDPWFLNNPEGIANDDHPHADIRLGQEFICDVAQAWVESPQFADGAMFITYDEWGGFWDHVPPPLFPDSQDDPTWERYTPPALNPGDNFVNGFGQAGMRVPTAVLSPWHTGGVVDHGVYDHVSILKFIGESFGLPVRELNPLRVDATQSIEASFDFSRPKNLDVEVQTYDAPIEVRTEPYLEQAEVDENPLFVLRDLGWTEKLGHRTDYTIEDTYRRSRTPITL